MIRSGFFNSYIGRDNIVQTVLHLYCGQNKVTKWMIFNV